MEFLGSSGMYFRGEIKKEEKKLRERKNEKNINEGGGYQPFPDKFYRVRRSRTSSRLLEFYQILFTLEVETME